MSVVEIQIEKKHQELLYLKKNMSGKQKVSAGTRFLSRLIWAAASFLSISANCMNCLNCSNTRLSNNANTDLPRRQQSDRQISQIITITHTFPLINQTFIAINKLLFLRHQINILQLLRAAQFVRNLITQTAQYRYRRD